MAQDIPDYISQFELQKSHIFLPNHSFRGTRRIRQPSAKIFSDQVVNIKMDKEQLQVHIKFLSRGQMTLDEYIWLLAEWELMLCPAYGLPISQILRTPFLPSIIAIYPSRITKNLLLEDIRRLAHKIEIMGLKKNDILYCLAQRRFIVDLLSESVL